MAPGGSKQCVCDGARDGSAGRVVLFRSTLLHQVCPSTTRPRRAITVWFFCPQAETAGASADTTA